MSHTNRLERQRFYDFPIHTATERYQQSGFDEEAYAEPTTRFANLQSALQCLLNDCGFDIPADPQGKLFREEV